MKSQITSNTKQVMKWILRKKTRNKLMMVQVYRENQIKNKPRNYIIVEILLDGMNLYYRPWHVVDNNDSAIFRFVIRLSGYTSITQELAKSIECPSSWWLTTALGLEWFLQFDFYLFNNFSILTYSYVWVFFELIWISSWSTV